MQRAYDIEPRLDGAVTIGSDKGRNLIWAGRVAERGRSDKIVFDGSDDFVVLEVGKRGSGKSYGMGAILESFATRDDGGIGTHTVGRAVLLLDPLDVHWAALQPLRPDGPRKLREQFAILERFDGLDPEPVNVRPYVPAGYEMDIDPPEFLSYQVPVADLGAGDWGHLLSCDIVMDTRGRLVDELHRKVTSLGWSRRGTRVPAKPDYTVQDLIDCAENDDDVAAFYHTETIRSVVQPLRSYQSMPLFESSGGTPLTQLVEDRVLTILSLGRLPAALRSVLTTVVIRKLRASRMVASQIRRRLALQEMDDDTRTRLETELEGQVPRTILAIDEAQILVPSKGASATRKEIDAYVLEGRNYGLSLWLATQRPKGAISGAAASQIDTFIVHRLSVQEDITAVSNLLQNSVPRSIRINTRKADLSELMRSLNIGEALFSSATSTAPRLFVGRVRPRVVAHGGEAF